MELCQIVFRWGVSLPYRLFGVGSIHLRGGESFLVLLLFFEALVALYTPLYALWLFAFFLMHILFTYQKKKKKKILSLTRIFGKVGLVFKKGYIHRDSF